MENIGLECPKGIPNPIKIYTGASEGSKRADQGRKGQAGASVRESVFFFPVLLL